MTIGKSLNVDTATSPFTSRMIDATQQWNSKGNVFNRFVTSRGIGVAVSVANIGDAGLHLVLCIGKTAYAISCSALEVVGGLVGYKGKVNPLKLSHWTVQEAATHLTKTIGYTAGAALNLPAAILSPKYLQIPVFVATGLSRQPKALQIGMARKALNKIKAAGQYVANHKKATAAVIGSAALIGTAVAYKYDYLPPVSMPTTSTVTERLPTMPSLSDVGCFFKKVGNKVSFGYLNACEGAPVDEAAAKAAAEAAAKATADAATKAAADAAAKVAADAAAKAVADAAAEAANKVAADAATKKTV